MANLDEIIETLHKELTFSFTRSSGPGGQNVNKVSTAAELRFDLANSPSLPAESKARLIRIAGRRMTSDGILIIEARRHRTQDANRDDALGRFDELVRQAFQRRKRRVATSVTRAARERRLASKKRRGEIKKTRQTHSYEG